MPLGRLVRVPRRKDEPALEGARCHCALDLEALILPALMPDGTHRRLEWPLPACATHEILASLPRELQDCPWEPTFATDIDGFSLATMQRKAERLHPTTPTLLIAVVVPRDEAISPMRQVVSAGAPSSPPAAGSSGGGADATGRRPASTLRPNETVVGAFMTEAPTLRHGAHKFFGTNETFAFRVAAGREVEPRNGPFGGFVAHRWREGCNDEFLLSSHQCLGVGGGKDGAALYFGADLQHGTTSAHCETFAANAPLVRGEAHGLSHVEFAVHRLWLLGIALHKFAPMSRVPAAQLLGSATMRRDDADGGEDAASSRDPSRPESLAGSMEHFNLSAYALPQCDCDGAHHRCRFIADAQQHRPGR